MTTIKSKDSDLSDYPAFKWCNAYGTDWYLPAREELKLIYNNKGTINSTLSANGHTTLGTSYYCSSTEGESSYVYRVYFNSGETNYGYKSYDYNVRAVHAF